MQKKLTVFCAVFLLIMLLTVSVSAPCSDKGVAYARLAKAYNLKQMATFQFMQE